jgi:hypothetical protein
MPPNAPMMPAWSRAPRLRPARKSRGCTGNSELVRARRTAGTRERTER